ncbi:MAG: HAMP domain-containing histidine kinase [Eubacterium sp.]|nr:HAMP domain-containing histidine kinase [Eubacterium sp.]
MEKLKNLSLKSTIILYMGIAMLISTPLSLVVYNSADRTQQNIWIKYIDEAYLNLEKEHGDMMKIPRVSSSIMTEEEVFVVELCDFIESWGPLLISFLGCCIAVFLFYRNKMRIPLKELKSASDHISKNDLTYEIDYRCDDEMGTLCKDFEKMRSELVKNEKKVWNLIDDERTLRSSIAHDIRTPITLIKGNLEMIDEFLPEKKIDEKKTIELISTTMQHVDHLEHFVEMMKGLNSIVDVEPEYKRIKYCELARNVQEVQKTLCEKNNIGYIFSKDDIDRDIEIDQMFVIEVAENLLNNAIRYAKSNITVLLQLSERYINLVVEDDGEGFKGNPNELMQAYNKSEEEGQTHYGLGLYISKSLCNAHNGKLQLDNNESGGARAVATFEIYILK